MNALMLDPVLLRTFLTIAEGCSFSETSRRLRLRQSTVSQHVRKLEEIIGHQLFVRDTHSVQLTLDGAALLGFARNILDTNERAVRYFAGTKLQGRLRFGTSEDLVLSWLPGVLCAFAQNHPLVDIELTIALSVTLIDRFDAGELDIVFCKRWVGDERGQLIWRDQMVWAGSKDMPLNWNEVPLVLYPPPSITRSVALEALERAGLSWRIACTSSALTGLVAAARAGMGFLAFSSKLIPDGLSAVDTKVLPALGEMEFVLLRQGRTSQEAVTALSAAIIAQSNLNECGGTL